MSPSTRIILAALATVFLLLAAFTSDCDGAKYTGFGCKTLGQPCYEGTFSKEEKFHVYKDCCSPSENFCDYDEPQSVPNGPGGKMLKYPGTCRVRLFQERRIFSKGGK